MGSENGIRASSYLLAAAFLALGAVVLAAINGTLTSDFRWVSYALFFLAGAVFFVGWVHVRNPLRQAGLGARAGVVLATLAALRGYAPVADTPLTLPTLLPLLMSVER